MYKPSPSEPRRASISNHQHKEKDRISCTLFFSIFADHDLNVDPLPVLASCGFPDISLFVLRNASKVRLENDLCLTLKYSTILLSPFGKIFNIIIS